MQGYIYWLRSEDNTGYVKSALIVGKKDVTYYTDSSSFAPGEFGDWAVTEARRPDSKRVYVSFEPQMILGVLCAVNVARIK